MKWLKFIGFGVLIWVIMFAVVSTFISFELYEKIYIKIIISVISGLLGFYLAGFVKPENMFQALAAGVVWVLVGLALDLLITARFNSDIFRIWSLWLGYCLLFVSPAFRTKISPLNE